MLKTKLMNTCMITNQKGEVLVQERANSWKGIAFPGGKVEECEGIVDSTIREIKEETGLVISDLKLCGIKTWFDCIDKITNIVFCFKTSTYSGKLTSLCNEGKNFWVNPDEIRNLNMADNFEATLDLYNKNITEILWKKENDKWDETRY